MALPHGKTIAWGPEAGGDSTHWYDFLESRKRIKRKKLWDGGSPGCPPGCKIVIVLPGGELSKPVAR